MDFFQILPLEMIEEITGYLAPKDYLHMAMSCQLSWHLCKSHMEVMKMRFIFESIIAMEDSNPYTST